MADFLDQRFDDDSGEDDDFNPAPEIDEDDVSVSTKVRQPAEHEEDTQGSARPSGSRSRSRRQSVDEEQHQAHGKDEVDDDGGAVNEEEEEDDEEDEEEEDDEEEVRGHSRKRRKRDARMQFIDVEAEVDEEDEEEVDEEEGDIQEEVHPDDLLDVRGDDRDDRRHRELDRQRELEASMDAEKQAAALRERYGRNRAAAVDSAVVPQRLLLPSVDDPSIWGVRVKPGKEQEVIFSITKRKQQMEETREPLQIFSAFERGAGTMQGYIYVEARTQNAVMAACEGVSWCFPRSKMILIPVAEMPDLLRVTKSKVLNPGAYVRMKRPAQYAGDLAQVVAVEANGVDVTVKLIPRIDYGTTEDVNAPPESKKRARFGGLAKTGPRPPQRLFSEVEARKGRNAKFLNINAGLGRREFTYKGDSYENGFLIKDFRINYLETENVNPKLDEVSRFAAGAADGTEELDLTALANTLKNSITADAFLPGDIVEISQGEQKGVFGKAISVRGDIVTIEVSQGDLKGQTVEAPVKALRKKFKEGDYVKVLAGKYQDEVGMIIKIKGDQVIFLADSNNQELPVLSKDLRLASATTGAPTAGAYDLYDLVQLDAATVACVVRVDRESLKVLDQSGSLRTMLPSQISNKIERRRNAVATDQGGSELRLEDTVKEVGFDAKQGRILHIHRNFLFCQNRLQTENAGVFVTRSTNVKTIAAKEGVQSGPNLSKMNPALQQQNGARNGGGVMAPPKTIGRDRLIGKTVHVKKGPHKGLLGIVKDTTDADARVELHTKSKTITIKKELLAIKDPITGQSMDFNRYGTARPRPGGATPSSRYGNGNSSATPSWGRTNAGAATPAWKSGGSGGGKTPAWSSAKTPAWTGGNDGGRTAYGGNDGSRTAYGGNDGSRTAYGGSGWSASSKTPNPYSSGAGSAWGSSASRNAYSGGKTPIPNAGSPANNTLYSAPTPAAFDAPTPGFSAPTPGDQPTPRYSGSSGYSSYATPAGAPTPGGAYSAPTPGGYADTPAGFPQTPGEWSAPTPAAAGDDEPRYE